MLRLNNLYVHIYNIKFFKIEVSQIRSEIEKRVQEKEEEFENTRKNHQRAMESVQVFDYIINVVVFF